MLSKKEKVKMLIKGINFNLFKNNLFKTNSLQEIIKDFPIVKTVDGEFSYGYDHGGIDYFLIFINKDKEGFMFIRSSYDNDEGYSNRDTFLSTLSFKKFERPIKDIFHINTMREEYIKKINSTEVLPLTINGVLSEISFSNFSNRITKNNRFKLIGFMMISFMFLFSNPFEKDFSNLVLKKIEDFNEGSDSYAAYEVNRNEITVYVLLEHYEYMLNNKISIFSVIDQIKVLMK